MFMDDLIPGLLIEVTIAFWLKKALRWTYERGGEYSNDICGHVSWYDTHLIKHLWHRCRKYVVATYGLKVVETFKNDQMNFEWNQQKWAFSCTKWSKLMRISPPPLLKNFLPPFDAGAATALYPKVCFTQKVLYQGLGYVTTSNKY